MEEIDDEIETIRTYVSFVRDAEGLMEFSRCKRGQFKNDWVSVGSCGMDIHFAIVQDANNGRRLIYCASVQDRLPYRLVATVIGSVKIARAWCTTQAQNISDVFAVDGHFALATVIEKPQAAIRHKKSADDLELEELEQQVKSMEKALAKAMSARERFTK